MTNGETKSDDGIYPYKPSQMATIVFAALFGASAIVHLWVMIKKKTWFYTSLNIGAFSALLSGHPQLPLTII